MNRLESRLTALTVKEYPKVAGRLADGATVDEADIDSLGVVGFLMALDQEFDIQLLTAKGVEAT